MHEEDIKPKNKIFHPKHRKLLFDTILVLAPFVIPHTSIPAALICIALILRDFHQSRKKDNE